MTPGTSLSKNILINALGQEDFDRLRPHLKRLPLDRGEELASFGDRIESVCFPEGAVVSLSTVLPDGDVVEAGVIGICGMVGWPALLGVPEHAHRVVVQVGGGSALQIPTEILLSVCRERPHVQALLLRYINVFTIQLTGAVASNLRDPVEKRLARWLLMCHDRLEGDEIALTHRFVGEMLGVRRATVTDALHMLEGHGAVRSHRNRITVRDRMILEEVAGGAYGYPEAKYRELIAPFGKGREER